MLDAQRAGFTQRFSVLFPAEAELLELFDLVREIERFGTYVGSNSMVSRTSAAVAFAI